MFAKTISIVLGRGEAECGIRETIKKYKSANCVGFKVLLAGILARPKMFKLPQSVICPGVFELYS